MAKFQELLREKEKELEKTLQCNCDLDRWEPERGSRHSHVCRIYRLARGLSEVAQ